MESKKKDLNILILGPRFPDEKLIKESCDYLRENKWENAYILEHFDEVDNIDLDYKFQSLVDKIFGKNLLIFAIFTKDIPSGGVEWELGFLQGLAFGKYPSDKGESLRKFQENTFVLLEGGDDSKITGMLTLGGFKKVTTLDWNDKDHLFKRFEAIAYNKLYSM